MAAATDPASLKLSDLVHGMSPSPAPQNQSLELNSKETPGIMRRSATPEALEEAEVAAIRRRVLEFTPKFGTDSHHISPREKELIDMVLKLTSPTNPTPSQILRQAETIAGLINQRNFMIREVEEERARWESEREGWERMAEALIAQRNRTARKSGNGNNGGGGYALKDEPFELERLYSNMEVDNRALRQKLTDTQYRLSALESQLTSLRPLLLMQPTISQAAYDHVHSKVKGNNISTPMQGSAPRASTSTLQSIGEEVPPIEVLHSDDESKPSASLPAGALEQEDASYYRSRRIQPQQPIPPPPHYRHAVYAYPSSKKIPQHAPPSTSKSKGKEKEKDREVGKEKDKERDKDKRKTNRVSTLTSDARTEHLLLAAQRVGRERAFVLGGLMQVEKEKARVERHRRKTAAEEDLPPTKDKNTTPKTPKRHGTKIGHKDSLGHPGPTTTPTGGAGGPGRGLFPVPTQGSFHLLNTPQSHGQSAGVYSTFSMGSPTTSPVTGGKRTGPPTPLDSLLSAARSMMVPASPSLSFSELGGDDSDSDYEGTPTAAATKRKQGRRTKELPESPIPPKKRRIGGGSLGGGRVRSALDVLADQAAAFSSSGDPGKSKTTGKGKEKEKEEEGFSHSHPPLKPAQSHPQPRPRTLMEENGTWNSLKPVQWGHSEEDDDEPSSSPVAETRQHHRDIRPITEPGSETLNLGQAELERMVMDTIAEAEKQTQVEDVGEMVHVTAPSSPLPAVEPDLIPTAPTPLNDSTTAPPMTLSRSQSEERVNGVSLDFNSQPSAGPSTSALHFQRRAASIPLDTSLVGNTHTRSETAPELGDMLGFDLSDEVDAEMVQAINRDLARVGDSEFGPDAPVKRPRSPYVKWSKEEDDMLAQAVEKYGQKWDLVQKALPSRGYHQVRQRWLRKLGVFDSKPDLSSYMTGGVSFPPNANVLPNGRSTGSPGPSDPNLPQPKLGMAPLSSELAYPRRS